METEGDGGLSELGSHSSVSCNPGNFQDEQAGETLH